MSKQLPHPGPQILPLSQIMPQLQSFKSCANLRQEMESRKMIISSSLNVKLEGNISGLIAVDFKNDFGYIPTISYNVVCPDKLFALQHYINSIDNKGFVLALQNEHTETREITINFRAM